MSVEQIPIVRARDKDTWIATALVYEDGTVDVQCEAISTSVKVDGRKRAFTVMDAENGGGVLAYPSWEAAQADGWET